MAKVSATYTGAYVTGAELQGHRRTAVIHAAVQEIVGQENAQPKIVLDLVSKEGLPWPRRLVLNKTNALHLAAAFGDDTDDWIGKTIEVWGEMVMFKGKATPGVRLAPVTGSVPVEVQMAGHTVARSAQSAGPRTSGGKGAAAPERTPDHVAAPSGEPLIDDQIPW